MYNQPDMNQRDDFQLMIKGAIESINVKSFKQI